jgi:hypothetical protein
MMRILWSVLVVTFASEARAQEPAEAGPVESPEDRGAPVEGDGSRTLAAVLFLATGGVDPTIAENLTEVLVAAVASSGRYAIVGREQFGAAMGIGGEEETLRCAEDPVCLGRIGTLVGAEEIVLGSLGERAGRYIVNLSRLDVRRARLIHRVFRTMPASIDPVIDAVGEGAAELMQPPPGAAHISVNVDDAELFIDGDEVTPDPDGVLRGLEPGEHVLLVRAEGYGEAEQRFEVSRGEIAELTVNLTRSEVVRVVEGTPVHRRWWFWTIIGVVLVGGGAAAAAVVLTQDEPASPSPTLGTINFP